MSRISAVVIAVGVLFGVFGSGSPCEAQAVADPLAGLSRLKSNQAIVVVDRSGREFSGILTRVTPAGIVMIEDGTPRTIAADDVGLVEVPGDSVGDGVAKGLIFGAPMWIGGASFFCDGTNAGGCALGVLINVGEWAGVAALIDRFHQGRTVVYHAGGPSPSGPVSTLSNLWAKVRTGDTVTIAHGGGSETTGVFQRLSGDSIVVTVNGSLREISQSDVARIARRGDSVKDGMLIGATLGFVTGLASSPCAQSTAHCHATLADRLYLASVTTSLEAAIGAGIDALITGRTVVYRSAAGPRAVVRLTPILAPARRGVMLSLRF